MHRERGSGVLCLRFAQFRRAGWPMSSNRNAASEPHSRERSDNAYHTRSTCLENPSVVDPRSRSSRMFLREISGERRYTRCHENGTKPGTGGKQHRERNCSPEAGQRDTKTVSRGTFKVVISRVRDIFS